MPRYLRTLLFLIDSYRNCNRYAQAKGGSDHELDHSAKLNGLDPYAYIHDVLERLPTQPATRITQLLPHHWKQSVSA